MDWHERIAEDDRFARMYGLSSFFVGEQRVAAELGPMMRAAPSEDMRIFLCTQIADEARHVVFFDRFYSEVGVLEAGDLEARLARSTSTSTPSSACSSTRCSATASTGSRVEPEDLETLVEAVTIYHMVIEGMLALTGQHLIISYNEDMGTLPAFVEGFTNVARDEHRHVAFGARFLREMAGRDPRYQRRDPAHAGRGRCRSPTACCGPSGATRPTTTCRSSGRRVTEARAFATKALERRLKVIGLAAAA